jgi:hypothetical protein
LCLSWHFTSLPPTLLIEVPVPNKESEQSYIWLCFMYRHWSINESKRSYWRQRIKDTIKTAIYASYLDLHLEIDSEGRLRMKKEIIANFPLWTEERTGLWLRQTEYSCGHLWHRYSVTVNQVIVVTAKLSKWWLI